MNRRPLIGIGMRLELATRRFYLGRDYSEAIVGVGGVPMQIPLIPDRAFLAEIVSRVDGILLPGSDSDVDPYRYGQTPHQKLGTVVSEKDECDLTLLDLAEQRGIPILGICFGMQSLNVSRNGTLVQDIESQLPNSLKHQQGMPLERLSHKLKIAEHDKIAGTVFGKIIENAGLNGDVFTNSHHHQAVDRVGEDLRAVAWAEDGIIECIEDTREGRFVFGVQWHPELNWKNDPLSLSIFNTFVKACSQELG